MKKSFRLKDKGLCKCGATAKYRFKKSGDGVCINCFKDWQRKKQKQIDTRKRLPTPPPNDYEK